MVSGPLPAPIVVNSNCLRRQNLSPAVSGADDDFAERRRPDRMQARHHRTERAQLLGRRDQVGDHHRLHAGAMGGTDAGMSEGELGGMDAGTPQDLSEQDAAKLLDSMKRNEKNLQLWRFQQRKKPRNPDEKDW